MITSKNYNQLTIQASLQEFSFFIKNQLTGELVFYGVERLNPLAALEEQLDLIFQKYEILQQQYDEVWVWHDNALNTFVPQAIFDEAELGAYLQYNTKVFSTDFFAFDEINTFQINNVYVPYVHLNNYLIDRFGSFNYQHLHTLLVSQCLEASSTQADITVQAYIQENRFEIVISHRGKLQFFNSFTYQSEQDFIYYILFVYEQLDLLPDQTPLYLMGDISEQSDLYLAAYQYIRELIINNKPLKSVVQTPLNHNPNQHYILFQS